MTDAQEKWLAENGFSGPNFSRACPDIDELARWCALALVEANLKLQIVGDGQVGVAGSARSTKKHRDQLRRQYQGGTGV